MECYGEYNCVRFRLVWLCDEAFQMHAIKQFCEEVLLLKILTTFKRWLEPFEVRADDGMNECSSIAARKAVEEGEKMHQLMKEPSRRIRLDVELAALTVVIPQTSSSANALVFDFGTFAI